MRACEARSGAGENAAETDRADRRARESETRMKDGLRFVDCDMHIMEPADLFLKWLDRRFQDRPRRLKQLGPDLFDEWN